jgi:hypothetical protein
LRFNVISSHQRPFHVCHTEPHVHVCHTEPSQSFPASAAKAALPLSLSGRCYSPTRARRRRGARCNCWGCSTTLRECTAQTSWVTCASRSLRRSRWRAPPLPPFPLPPWLEPQRGCGAALIPRSLVPNTEMPILSIGPSGTHRGDAAPSAYSYTTHSSLSNPVLIVLHRTHIVPKALSVRSHTRRFHREAGAQAPWWGCRAWPGASPAAARLSAAD